jgi:hypothetical protein
MSERTLLVSLTVLETRHVIMSRFEEICDSLQSTNIAMDNQRKFHAELAGDVSQAIDELIGVKILLEQLANIEKESQ